MCYAIPGKLVRIDGLVGTVDYFGEERKVLMDSEGVSVGDYVYAQGGVLIRKVEEKEAQEILEFWKERFFALKEKDKELAKVEDSDASSAVLEILQKVNLGMELERDELLRLMKVKDGQELKLIYETANNVRQKDHDNACCVHGLIEFGNHCNYDCHYCGIRKSQKIDRYRMDVGEIIAVAKSAVDDLGFKAIVLQSGEDTWYDEEKLVDVVKAIRAMGVLVFVSVGVRTKELYQKLYDAGARGVLLRFETSNKEVFSKLRPGTELDERLKRIRELKEIGYLVATGFMIGLPGESDSDMVDNILLTKELGAEMYSFGPFIPAEGTPLEGTSMVGKEKALKAIALSRFVDRRSKILVTTALETLDKRGRREGLLAGANSLMVNVTPAHYRGLYSIYPNRPDKDIGIKKNIDETIELLYDIGRAPTDIGL